VTPALQKRNELDLSYGDLEKRRVYHIWKNKISSWPCRLKYEIRSNSLRFLSDRTARQVKVEIEGQTGCSLGTNIRPLIPFCGFLFPTFGSIGTLDPRSSLTSLVFGAYHIDQGTDRSTISL
jgi:hypothetical protein